MKFIHFLEDLSTDLSTHFPKKVEDLVDKFSRFFYLDWAHASAYNCSDVFSK